MRSTTDSGNDMSDTINSVTTYESEMDNRRTAVDEEHEGKAVPLRGKKYFPLKWCFCA